ncbi:imidazole glycerol phosphate synthase subunit HisH [Oenococcus kitaharae]|uniref:Imidazole glycerol phosphate synthase subunit HisH n=1 Tax=Oenococcus kitaharae DSM 17330 TaxID=1045004 RepID=G9WHC4_9LACO|nr:imidazole glycerol phosphate synthase subunit HisH [Oenococcus kitaharae]EHN59769.1 Imidazole glycerol phosphate synthase amidotransferase subunit [Oenococcus kitaharae DSM 17330]OEY83593.1 imidazole glycerol phosphate synthase [Oenococcus kitaharae]OEY85391.1 imidazole glycerol phosphate synthase [Oenococcus kitaharae]OEY86244.1 imidazole glycerol phosphate synthase [Oenococcus kitaharae]
MLTIIDYDAGNTYNLQKAFRYLGIQTELTDDPKKILASQALILPGVGAFKAAMAVLNKKGLTAVLQKAASQGMPILGICLGMQLLFDSSSEYGFSQGLHLIPGKVVQLPEKPSFKIPQMGWNQNYLTQANQDFQILDQAYTYFVHSYYVQCADEYVLSQVDYSVAVPALVEKDNVYGMQFHPEKSGQVGLSLLEIFNEKVAG